jgi:hypothetical protein
MKADEFFASPIIDIIGEYKKDDFDDSYYIISKSTGLTFLFEFSDANDMFYLHTIFLEACEYTKKNLDDLLGIVPLNFEADMVDLTNYFGEPKKSGGGGKGLLGEIPKWVKFQHDTAFIHFQFRLAGEFVDKITITK